MKSNLALLATLLLSSLADFWSFRKIPNREVIRFDPSCVHKTTRHFAASITTHDVTTCKGRERGFAIL